MLEFGAVEETSATPEQVLAGVVDVTERRAEIFPNVKKGHFEVHDTGDGFAEVTEELWPIGMWERSRYEWPQPGSVKGTVLESNVLEPGSTWELTATPIEGGSRVETVFRREFPKTARGRIGRFLNRFGSSFARSDLRRMLKEIESGAADAGG